MHGYSLLRGRGSAGEAFSIVCFIYVDLKTTRSLMSFQRAHKLSIDAKYPWGAQFFLPPAGTFWVIRKLDKLDSIEEKRNSLTVRIQRYERHDKNIRTRFDRSSDRSLGRIPREQCVHWARSRILWRSSSDSNANRTSDSNVNGTGDPHRAILIPPLRAPTVARYMANFRRLELITSFNGCFRLKRGRECIWDRAFGGNCRQVRTGEPTRRESTYCNAIYLALQISRWPNSRRIAVGRVLLWSRITLSISRFPMTWKQAQNWTWQVPCYLPRKQKCRVILYRRQASLLSPEIYSPSLISSEINGGCPLFGAPKRIFNKTDLRSANTRNTPPIISLA